jgi:hypothetical protein
MGSLERVFDDGGIECCATNSRPRFHKSMRLPWWPGERNELVAHRRVERGMWTAGFRSIDGRESHVRADWHWVRIFPRN